MTFYCKFYNSHNIVKCDITLLNVNVTDSVLKLDATNWIWTLINFYFPQYLFYLILARFYKIIKSLRLQKSSKVEFNN